MYKITIQTLTGIEKTLYYPGSDDYIVSSAELSLKVGSAGEFNFTVPQGNPLYNEIIDHAIITIYEDNAEIWRGDIRDIQQNFDKSLAVYALEDLAWLGEETVAMTAINNQTYLQRFAAVMANYNQGQPAKRQFLQGQLTSVTTANTCHWQPQYGETLLDCIRRCIADNGYLKIRRVTQNGTITRYLDILLLEDYGQQASQKIEFGYNLLDFVKEIDNTNFLNVLYPYGAEIEETLYGDIMKRMEGTPIQNDASIAAFGRHARSVVFETESLATLNRLALAYLNRYSQPSLKIQAKAIDLGNIEMVSRLHLGDSVRIVAAPFAVDQWDYITSQSIDLLDISNNQVSLSDSIQTTTLTAQVITQAKEIEDARTPDSILNAAKQNAYAILTGENGGIVTFIKNNNDQIVELMIANNLDINQATKAWRWNLNGLAYLHRTLPSEAWTVGIAATMDGGFVADFINTGTLNALNVNVINLNANNIVAGRLQDKYGYNYLDLDTVDVRLVANAKLRISNPDYTGAYVPSHANAPASGWTTVDSNKAALGKVFKNTTANAEKFYIYKTNPNNLPQSTHPTGDRLDVAYRVQTYLQAPIKIKFNANCEMEQNFDYLYLYYENGGTSYKRTFTGAFGGTEITLPVNTFYLRMITDASVGKWGFKIDSITPTAGNTSSGFTTEARPTSFTDYYLHGWEEVTIDTYTKGVSDAVIEGISGEDYFNKLTNGGQDQGLYYYGGKVYLNGEYVKTGSLNANDIQAGVMSCNRINGGVLSLGGTDNEYGQIYVVGAPTRESGDSLQAGAYVTYNFMTLRATKVTLVVTNSSAPSGSASGTYTAGPYSGTLYENGTYHIGTFPANTWVEYTIRATYAFTFALYKAEAQTIIDNTRIRTNDIYAAYINAVSGLIGDFTLQDGELIYAGIKTVRSTTVSARASRSKTKRLTFRPEYWNVTANPFKVGVVGKATGGSGSRTISLSLQHYESGWVTKSSNTVSGYSAFTSFFSTNISNSDSSSWRVVIEINSGSDAYTQDFDIKVDWTNIACMSTRGFEGDFLGAFTGDANVRSFNAWDWDKSSAQMQTYTDYFDNWYGTTGFGLGFSPDGSTNSVLRWLPEDGRLLLRQNFNTSEDRGIIVSNYNPSDRSSNDFSSYYAIHKPTGMVVKRSGYSSESQQNYDKFRVGSSSLYSNMSGGALQIVDSSDSALLNVESLILNADGTTSTMVANNSENALNLDHGSGRQIYMTANSDEATLRVCSSFSSKWMYLVSRPENQDIVRYDGSYQSVSWSTSDRRAKEDIEELDTELSKNLIDATETKRFKYKGKDGIHYGMIAQDARELLDNLGETESELEHSMHITGPDAVMDDQRTIDYHEYIPHIINYIKDLKAEIMALKNEVRILKEERNDGKH